MTLLAAVGIGSVVAGILLFQSVQSPHTDEAPGEGFGFLTSEPTRLESMIVLVTLDGDDPLASKHASFLLRITVSEAQGSMRVFFPPLAEKYVLPTISSAGDCIVTDVEVVGSDSPVNTTADFRYSCGGDGGEIVVIVWAEAIRQVGYEWRELLFPVSNLGYERLVYAKTEPYGSLWVPEIGRVWVSVVGVSHVDPSRSSPAPTSSRERGVDEATWFWSMDEGKLGTVRVALFDEGRAARKTWLTFLSGALVALGLSAGLEVLLMASRKR